ncbi:MFS transporter [Limnoglobus roseus]|uniref:MFS transporter n=1 Tax=Limnoglobus roseus TaxID=2598579 RepID=A0A5C1A894_9BACT|nr:MFS transporter [Limnoglobus roseus]
MCGTLMLATLLNYMDRQALPQTATDLKALYHLDDTRYGLLEGCFSYAFAAGSILFGLIADRVGPRRLYPLVLLGWSAAGLLTPCMAAPSITQHLEGPGDEPGAGPFRWLLLCRTILGLFESGHWPCALLTARQILTAAERPLGNGLLQSGASLGAILIPLYVREVRHLGGEWGVVFWTVGAGGLLWIPLWLVLVRPNDLNRPLPPSADAPVGPPTSVAIRQILTLAVVVASLTVSWQFLRAWLPKYLKESQKLSADDADFAVAGFYIAAEIGCLLSGVWVKLLVSRGLRVHSARLVGFTLYAAITALAAVVPLADSNSAKVSLLMVAGAGILGLHPYYYALAQELPAKWMASLSGTLAASAWFLAGFVQTQLGSYIDQTKSYALGLTIAGLAPLTGLVAVVLLWPSRGRVTS